MNNPDRKKYQKDYWAAYKKGRRQVKGMLSNSEYAAVKKRADATGLSVWQQIREESAKYAAGEFLSSEEIRENIQNLFLEIRGIAGIIKSTRAELGAESDAQMLATLRELEEKIETFTRQPWGEKPNSDLDK